MGKITPEQAAKVLNLILKANVTDEAVEKTLIERFDLIETMLKHPEAVTAMNTSLFESFILGCINSPAGLFEEASSILDSEEVPDYNYPSGWKLKSVQEQRGILSDFFPDFTSKTEIPASIPEGGEGWLLIPKPSRIANTYNEALEIMLSLITQVRPAFLNSRNGKLGPAYLRLTEKTNHILTNLDRSTPGDYLLLAIQCGLQHRAKPVSQARKTFKKKEFGLGPFEIASLLLTHPERLTDYEHLGIDCPGCEYAANSGGNFNYSLCFTWNEEGLYFDYSSIDGIAPGFGSASGFIK
ncbi:MAG: hypothetical protein PHN78_01530 [Dehalococcoidales bacterium]|nr:hypothetical protein [Dehalococcoidales bacterium]